MMYMEQNKSRVRGFKRISDLLWIFLNGSRQERDLNVFNEAKYEWWCALLWSVLWIRIFLNLDPDQIRIQGFDDQKLKKIFLYIFSWSKIAIYLSLGLYKRRPSFNPQKKTSST